MNLRKEFVYTHVFFSPVWRHSPFFFSFFTKEIGSCRKPNPRRNRKDGCLHCYIKPAPGRKPIQKEMVFPEWAPQKMANRISQFYTFYRPPDWISIVEGARLHLPNGHNLFIHMMLKSKSRQKRTGSRLFGRCTDIGTYVYFEECPLHNYHVQHTIYKTKRGRQSNANVKNGLQEEEV